MSNPITPAKFSEAFNSAAESAGCKMRIQAGKRAMKYFRHSGFTGDRETWFPITALAFDQGLDAFPALRAFLDGRCR